MVEVFPKWIIEGNSLVIRKATFHREIAENVNNVKGGGWFEFDRDREAFILYGKSEDFGICSKETVHDAVSRRNVGRFINDERYANMKIYFSSSDSLENALDNMVELVPYEINEDVERLVSFKTKEVSQLVSMLGAEYGLTQSASAYKAKSKGITVKVRTEPKIGRNEPCPCNSGKKYKKCCLI